MNAQLEHTTEILDRHISGFRQYSLGTSAVPTFISRNFCDMTGYTPEELLSGDTPWVHPSDKEIYDGYLRRAAVEKRSCAAEYRILRKDGSVI